MTFTSLGDEFPAAARELSDAAFRTHIEALCWSAARLLDLLLPKREVRRFAETADPETAVEELISKGWWQDCGDAGYFIGCRFREWQQERVVVEKRRAANALRKRRQRLHAVGDHSLCTDRCPHVMSRRDGTRDETRDSGRVGKGREVTTDLEEKEQEYGEDDLEHGLMCACDTCATERDFYAQGAGR
jgi:hypothetical protein